MNKTGVIILLVIVGGVLGASALFLMPPNPVYNPNPPRAIMTILDKGVNQETLQIKYGEKTQKTECLGQTLVFLETTELIIENVSFTDTVGDGSGDDLIVVSFTNVGTKNVEFEQVNLNGVTQTGNWELTSDDNNIECGLTVTVQVTANWTAGNKYSIQFHLTDGTVISPLFAITA